MAASSSSRETKETMSEEKTHPLLREEAILASRSEFRKNQISLKQVGKWILEGNKKAELHSYIIKNHIHPYTSTKYKKSAEIAELVNPILAKPVAMRTANENILAGVYYILEKTPLFKRELFDLSDNENNPRFDTYLSELREENAKQALASFQRANRLKPSRTTFFWLAFLYQTNLFTQFIGQKNGLQYHFAVKAAYGPAKGVYSSAALNLLSLHHNGKHLRTLAMFYKIPDAMYKLGKSLFNHPLTRNDGLKFLHQAMQSGNPNAAFELGDICKVTGRLDLAALCYSAATKYTLSRGMLKSFINKNNFTTFPLVTRYRICMAILHAHTDMDSSCCEKAKEVLKFLFGFKEVLEEFKKNKSININEDISLCDTKTAAELNQTLMTQDAPLVAPLNRALQIGDTALIKFYADTIKPTPSKSNALSEVLIHFNNHCKEAKSKDGDLNRYIHAIMELLPQYGARITEEDKAERKDETSTSIVVTLLQTLETLPSNDASRNYAIALSLVLNIYLNTLIKIVSLSPEDLYAAVKTFGNRSHPFFYDDYKKFEERNMSRYEGNFNIIESFIAVKEHLLKQLPKLLDKPNKDKYCIKLYTLSLQMGRKDCEYLPVKTITKEDLNKATSKDIIDLLITALGDDVKYLKNDSEWADILSVLSLIDPVILRELPLDYLNDGNKIITLLSRSLHDPLMSPYHTAMKILQTLETTHPCYQYACGCMERILSDQAKVTHLKKILGDQLIVDIKNCKPEINKVFLNLIEKPKEDKEKETILALKRSVYNFNFSLFRQSLQEYDHSKNQKINLLLEKLQTLLVKRHNLVSTDNEHKKNGLYSDQSIRKKINDDIRKIEDEIDTIQNSLKSIKTEKQKLMRDLFDETIKKLENHYAGIITSPVYSSKLLDENLHIIIRLAGEIEDLTNANKILFIIKRIHETRDSNSLTYILIDRILEKPLKVQDRYDCMKIILNNYILVSNPTLINHAIDSYLLCTRIPDELKSHSGIVKSKLNIDRIVESLSLLISINHLVSSNNQDTIKKYLFRDIVHIHNIYEVANLLRIAIKNNCNYYVNDDNENLRASNLDIIKIIIAKAPTVLRKISFSEQINILFLLINQISTSKKNKKMAFIKTLIKIDKMKEMNMEVYFGSIITKLCSLLNPKDHLQPRFKDITLEDVNVYIDQCFAEESIYSNVHSFYCFPNKRLTVESKEEFKQETKEVKTDSTQVEPKSSEGQAEDKVIARIIANYAAPRI